MPSPARRFEKRPSLDALVQRVDAQRPGEITGDTVPTGFGSLDKVLGGGMRRRDLILLGGDIGSGKSALALGIALRVAQDGANVNLYKDGLFTALGLGKSNKGKAALDLSESGARVLVIEHLAPGTKIRLKIEMDKYQDSVEVDGVIRWCVPYRREFQAGIMFSEADPSIRRPEI